MEFRGGKIAKWRDYFQKGPVPGTGPGAAAAGAGAGASGAGASSPFV
jgi:hypothetical protein